MSLYINANFTDEVKRLTHGEVPLQTDFINVSEVTHIRAMARIKGKDASALGTFTMSLFGKIRNNLETVEIGNHTITATGLVEAISSKLFDISGYDAVCLKVSYSRVATDYVDLLEAFGSATNFRVP